MYESARIVSPLRHFEVEPKMARCRSPFFNGSAIHAHSNNKCTTSHVAALLNPAYRPDDGSAGL